MFKIGIVLLLFSLNSSLSLAVFADDSDAKLLAEKYCSECHQADGNSTDENIPKIAGFSAALTYDILDQFRSGYRDAKEIKNKNGQMTNMVKISKKLKEDEIETLSSYFSEQVFKPEEQAFNKSLIKTGKQLHLDLCNDCHVDLATNSDDDAPILSGQWKAYLSEQFKHFSMRERKMTRRMKRKFRKLNNDDKVALIEFYASTKEKKDTSK
jgi:sulfide dehydrogenase cytochrome subunit